MSRRATLEQLLLAFKANLIDQSQMADHVDALIQDEVADQLRCRNTHSTELAPETLVIGARHDSATQAIAEPQTDPTALSMDQAEGDSIETHPVSQVNATDFAARYIAQKLLGEGGIGQVLETHDRILDRHIAVKVLKPDRTSVQAQHRFIREASTTAQLQHPNIVPVYDMGTKEDGQPWFSMKCVRGMSLQDILAGLFSPKPDGALKGKYTQFRLLQTFVDVCNAVEYAHDRQVIHRDIKPDNIMVGSFGEVLLMDWGVARLAYENSKPQRANNPAPIITDISNLERTQDGIIVGTPGYMAPEQARGEIANIDERTDIWALGATLYAILTGKCPFAESTLMQTLIATVREPIIPPSKRNPKAKISPDLDEICAKALQKNQERRYQTVAEMRLEIEEFLTGALETRRRIQDADTWVTQSAQLQAQHERLNQARQTILATLNALPVSTGHEPLKDKRHRWNLEKQTEDLAHEIADIETKIESALGRAIESYPQHEDARLKLSLFHAGQYRVFRALEDRRSAARHLTAIHQYGHGAKLAFSPDVPLTIQTGDMKCSVYLCPLDEEDRRLVPASRQRVGTTPFSGAVPPGHHVIQLEPQSGRAITLSISVWQADRLNFDIDIPSDVVLGPDFVLIPSGPFLRGHDPMSVNGRPSARPNLKTFAIGRYPVTCGEYRDFLASLDDEEVRLRIPRDDRLGNQPCWPLERSEWQFPIIDVDGDAWAEDWPIININHDDAEAYCAWRSRQDGMVYRLPTDDEWEKAARGADGRYFPWGNHFDPTFCHMRSSLPSGPNLGEVNLFVTDESAYGVRCLAGGVREWTSSRFDDYGYSVRGGSWKQGAALCRLASRWGHSASTTASDIGFRLVKDLERTYEQRPVVYLSER
ncbi:MAG: SUMF1/EgtB/PvdO family nonheme iron enzyme [Myxococcota bacterium]|nr:SUMF1/EgtB/PvdO family nonheme iron enzyme [Myxococcota bacterium]